jgi:dihydroorotate dehydrogenase (NAD+) catalytic subunit
MSGTYLLDRSYDWNYQHGPVFSGSLPPVPKTPLKDFFGYPVASRLGVPAGLLLNARWIDFYARAGFDILTYKTVRSQYRACYELPNWVFVDRTDQVDPQKLDEAQRHLSGAPADFRAATSSVSFGMPSKAPEEWMPDVERARAALGPGQVLIVSVVASPAPGSDVAEMIADFSRLAAMAREAGAQIVEANLSCPNVCTAEGDIFLDPELSGAIAIALREGAGDLPVLLKLGYFAQTETIEAVLSAVNGAASGVVMVNGISRRVVGADGAPAFGEGREVSGILGRAIHAFSLDNVKTAIDIIAAGKLDLGVVAVGGVSMPEDAADFFDAGAKAVMLGSAPMFDPALAAIFKAAHPEW